MGSIIENSQKHQKKIDQLEFRKCVHKSEYKIINLLRIQEEERNFLESVGLSINYLSLNQNPIILENDDNIENILTSNHQKRMTREYLNECLEQMLSIKNGYIQAVCPKTGKLLKSNHSFFSNYNTIFYRFESEEVEVFYLIISLGHRYKSKYALYFPNIELIVELRNFHNPKIKHYQIINHFKLYVIDNLKEVYSYLQNKNSKKIMVIINLHNNIGHQLWNDLSAIQEFINVQTNLDKVDSFFVIGVEQYGKIEEIFPEIPQGKVKRLAGMRKEQKSISEIINEQIFVNNLLAVSLAHNSIQEELNDRLKSLSLRKCSTETKNTIELAQNNFPLLYIFIRGKYNERVWVSQVKGIAHIINHLSLKFPNLGIIFDGFTLSEDQSLYTKFKSNIDDEKQVVQDILKLIEKKIPIFDIIGSTMHEGILWANIADLYLAPWGAGLIKVAGIANKPGVITSNTKVLNLPNDGKFWWSIGRPHLPKPVLLTKEQIIDKKTEFDKNPRHDRISYDCDIEFIYKELLKICSSLNPLK